MIATVILNPIPDDVINISLVVMSILVGFGFNVLFFMLSNKHKNLVSVDSSIEQKKRIDIANKLYSGLIYNISYLNLMALLFVVYAFAYLSLGNAEFKVVKDLLSVFSAGDFSHIYDKLHSVSKYFLVIFSFLFFLLYVEVLSTLFRVIVRTSFYFETKLKIENTE